MDTVKFISDPSLINNFDLQLDVVDEIHDFHIWSLGEGKPIMTAHVVTDANPSYALYKITELLQTEFEIYHATI